MTTATSTSASSTRMGAHTQRGGPHRRRRGRETACAAQVRACDLRAGAAMVIAGLPPRARPRSRTSTISSAATRTIVGKLRGAPSSARCERPQPTAACRGGCSYRGT